jgi:hypothetical protein
MLCEDFFLPRLRDQKNREMFEKYFPELKLKREHQERMTR